MSDKRLLNNAKCLFKTMEYAGTELLMTIGELNAAQGKPSNILDLLVEFAGIRSKIQDRLEEVKND